MSADPEYPNDPTGVEPISLLFETSPLGNVDAIVQHDGRSVYFYLNGRDGFGTRACWVRNLVPGPYVINAELMRAGVPPMLPRTHCKYSEGRPAPDIEELSVVWFEEGNGAALLERNTVLAVIPPWSGVEGFHGYAAECAADSSLCWPMPDHPSLARRIDRAHEFWRSFESAETNPFVSLQTQTLARYRQRFGQETEYYAIDGGAFPPRGLARFQQQNRMTLLTVGMSLCPLPVIELFVDHPSDYRRIEIGLQIDLGHQPFDPERLAPLLEQISGLAAQPWKQWTWFGPGHTCTLSELAGLDGIDHQQAVFLADSAVTTTDPLLLFRDDPVRILWLIPISDDEQARIASGKTAATDLIQPDRYPRH